MSPNQIIIFLMILIVIILISSGIKFTAWLLAKRNGNRLYFFLTYYFKWFDVYALWDSTDDIEKRFMKINNRTNIVIWIATIVSAIGLYVLQWQYKIA